MVKRQNIIVVGQGKLAEIILNELPAQLPETQNICVRPYSEKRLPELGNLFVHVGSGREYKATLNRALERGTPYIQAATEKDYPLLLPLPGKIPFINAPNLDLTIIKFFHWLKMGRNLFSNERKSIRESHQASKKSVPGTALKMADLLGIKQEGLISIRDEKTQQKLPIANLNHHAYHEIIIGEEDSFLRLETNITGHSSYVRGLASIISAVPQLNKNNYEIEELVKRGLI